MGKQAEIEYLGRIGDAGASHARGKPFTDVNCGGMLTDLGALFMLLPPPPARLLDLGCGSGWTSLLFARHGYEVVGQDIAPAMIELAEASRVEAGLKNVRFVVSDYESLAFADEFDCALFYDALHHAEDPAAALSSAARALKPGGVLVTIEPGTGHAAAEHSRNAVTEYGVTERDMPPREIVRLARRAGFSGARVHPSPKVLAGVQYRMPRLERFPGYLSDLIRWLGLGYLTLVGKRRREGLVVLRK